MKNRLNLAIGLIVSALFVYLAFRRVEPAEIIYSLKNVNYIWIIPNMVAVMFLMGLRAERWKYLLQPVKVFTAARLFPAVMIGFMANNVLPARLGELVRAYSLGRTTGESRSSIFATIVLERIFDSLSLLTMFWLVILFVPFPPAVKKFGIFTLVINVAAVLFLVALKYRGEGIIRLVSKIFSFLPGSFRKKIESILSHFTKGLNVFKNLKILMIISFWSAVIWVITALSNYFIFMAFGIYPHFIASFILLLFVAAGVMLPSAPGYIGVFQAAVVAAFGAMNHLGIIGHYLNTARVEALAMTLTANAFTPIIGIGAYCESLGLFGISKGEALSFSIVLWLCQFIPVTLIGFYYLRREHLSLGKIEI